MAKRKAKSALSRVAGVGQGLLDKSCARKHSWVSGDKGWQAKKKPTGETGKSRRVFLYREKARIQSAPFGGVIRQKKQMGGLCRRRWQGGCKK